VTIQPKEYPSAEESTTRAPSKGASEKTILVLEAALSNERFTDITEETGLTKTTVHRILSTLVDQNFISGDARGGYRPGPRFLALAGRALDSIDISSLAQPFVDELVANVDCTVHVGVASGDEIVYVIRTDSSKPYRMRSRVGLSLPDQEILRLAERTGLPARTKATITEPEKLLEDIRATRARGYALDLGENEDGTVCVSAPIYDHTNRVTHGLSISSIALEHPARTIETLAPAAMATAAKISRHLGANVEQTQGR
jgi:DNA-binding IclR family transcriptional regulator